MITDLSAAQTFLFVPGDRPDRFDKAASSGADLVIIDLEDGVAQGSKDLARHEAVRWLGRSSAHAAVRINGVGTSQHRADVAAVRSLPNFRFAVLPMAENPMDIEHLAAQLPQVEFIALIETALGVSLAEEIAKVSGVSRLAFGHLDYAADINADPDGAAMVFARSVLVGASRVGSLPGPIDSVTTAIDDASSVANDARNGRALGFSGKLCIHPSQVEVVRQSYQPTEFEVEFAKSVMEHASDGRAARIGGMFVDRPVVARAKATLLKDGRNAT